MRHVRCPEFEGLEPRKLPTKAHPTAAHVAVTLVLDGTLAVDNAASSVTVDAEQDSTTSTPVAGVLGPLGKVRGVWDKSVDYLGDYLGTDTLQLHNAHGTFVIAFNTADPGKVRRSPQGDLSYEISQRVRSGTAAYARASESGTIELTTNPAKTLVEKMTLGTGKT